MNSLDDLVAILRDEIGIPVTVDDARRDLAELPGWDSIHLLRLLTILQETTGTEISLAEVLEASSLEHLHKIVADR